MAKVNSIVRLLRSGLVLCAAAGACLCLIAVGAHFACAQASPAKNVSVSFDRAPIQVALKDLFTQAGLNYALDPSVTGNITATLHNVSFQVALVAVLNANRPRLAYDVRDGVYHIHPLSVPIRSRNAYPSRPYAANTATSRTSDRRGVDTVRIPLDYANAALLAEHALGGGRIVPPSYPGVRSGSTDGRGNTGGAGRRGAGGNGGGSGIAGSASGGTRS